MRFTERMLKYFKSFIVSGILSSPFFLMDWGSAHIEILNDVNFMDKNPVRAFPGALYSLNDNFTNNEVYLYKLVEY